ncbi:MAG: glutathione S-transferase family protein [Hyphomonadaceae bacterium]|nr:glutathione S-transferase family protein [Hyphomonadaceae bacterium]
MMLRILGRPTSLNVRKVLVTLDEIGAPYAHEPQWATPAAPSQSAEFRKLNPNGLIPVIEDENGLMWESNAICRYLAAKHARADLFPLDFAVRARIDMWMDWQAAELNDTWRYAFMALAKSHPRYTDPEKIAESVARWNAALAILDARLAATRAYVAGDAYTLADIVLGVSAHRWRATPLEHADLPAVRGWLAMLDARPAFAKYATAEYP